MKYKTQRELRRFIHYSNAIGGFMYYRYVDYEKYDINRICDAYINETSEDFFRICKALKFTIHSYPGENKRAEQVKLLDEWMEKNAKYQDIILWKKLLEESNLINMLYKDLYDDPLYFKANEIEDSKELSATLVCTEYILSAMLDASIGDMSLCEQMGVELGSEECIEGINDRARCYGEMFDNISIKIRDVLEYIIYYKKHKCVCEKVSVEDIENARGHILSILKKTCIDMVVEGWQFGDPKIILRDDLVDVVNDYWGHVIRIYWEIRERSNVATWSVACEDYQLGIYDEDREIEIAKRTLQKQLFVNELNQECKIFRGNKLEEIVDIFDIVKGYARLKTICNNHLLRREDKEISGDIGAVCVCVEKENIEKQFQAMRMKNPKQILKRLIYGRGRDIVDAPLIEWEGKLYMIPTLVKCASISEVVLSIASTFEFRGKALERELLKLLKEEKICCGKLKKHEKSDTFEYDSLFVIDNSMFIVESKAWGFPRNITEYYFMNNKILKAYNQVNRLEEYVRGNMSIVLKCLNLPVDYKIDTIYKIILSNFQRADNQILEDVFLCDFNMFKGFVKDIAPGIVVRNTDDSIEKWVFEEKRKTPITSDEVIEFLQGNIARDICISLLEEQVFCDSINKLYIRKSVLQRKVGLMVFQRDE